jgi:hypothetical protein
MFDFTVLLILKYLAFKISELSSKLFVKEKWEYAESVACEAAAIEAIVKAFVSISDKELSNELRLFMVCFSN